MDYIVKAYKDWKLHSQFHEIVPDMDDDYMFNEKQSIRESARSLKKYGSTCCNHIRNNETLIRHEIDKADTLQGIALKYGCSTEQIRRANRLFTSDSLFLRQFLLVPVDKASPYYPNHNDSNNIMDTTENTQNRNANSIGKFTSPTAGFDAVNNPRPSALPPRPYSIAGEPLQMQGSHDDAVLNNHHSSSGSSGTSSKQSKSLDSVAAMSPEEENRKCINDFLNKIDTTISESRKYVEKSKEMIASQSDNDLFVTTDFVERHRNNHINNSYRYQNENNQRQQHQNHMRQSSSGSASDTAHLLNTTQTRRVQNSLKQLEKQQDEFFEL